MDDRIIYARTRGNLKANQVVDLLRATGLVIDELTEEMVIDEGSVVLDFYYGEGNILNVLEVLSGNQPHYISIVFYDKFRVPVEKDNDNIHILAHQAMLLNEKIVGKITEKLPNWVASFILPQENTEVTNEITAEHN